MSPLLYPSFAAVKIYKATRKSNFFPWLSGILEYQGYPLLIGRVFKFHMLIAFSLRLFIYLPLTHFPTRFHKYSNTVAKALIVWSQITFFNAHHLFFTRISNCPHMCFKFPRATLNPIFKALFSLMYSPTGLCACGYQVRISAA